MLKIKRRRKVSAHAEVSRNFANALCPFSQSMGHTILSKDKNETNKNVKRERERDRERERERLGRGEERDREGGGQVMSNVHNLCFFCHNVFRKAGAGESSEVTNSGMETVKIHVKTIQ